MSEMIGETFVSIVPVTNQAEFEASAQSQVTAAMGNVKASVTLDTAGIQAQLKSITAELNAATKQGITLQGGDLSGVESQVTSLVDTFATLQKEIAATGASTVQAGAEIQSLGPDIAALTAATDEYAASLRQVEAQEGRTADAGGQRVQTERTLQDQLKQISGSAAATSGKSAALTDVEQQAASVQQELSQVRQSLVETGTAAQETVGRVAPLGGEFEKQKVAAAEYAQTLEAVAASEAKVATGAAARAKAPVVANPAAQVAALAAELPPVVVTAAVKFDTTTIQEQVRALTAELNAAVQQGGVTLQGTELAGFEDQAGVLLNTFEQLQKEISATGATSEQAAAAISGLTPDFAALTTAAGEYAAALRQVETEEVRAGEAGAQRARETGGQLAQISVAVPVGGAAALDDVAKQAATLQTTLDQVKGSLVETGAATARTVGEVAPLGAEFAAQKTAATEYAGALDQVAATSAKLGATGAPTISTQVQEQRIAALKAASAEAATAVTAVNQRMVVGQATTAEGAVVLDRYVAATLAASKAEVELDIALGRESSKENLALLTRARLTEETEILTAAERRRAQSLGLGGGGGGGGGGGPPRGPTELRGAIREVASGEAGLGSLLGPAAILRFGAAGLAIGAVVSTLGALTKALKVDGEEALTTEGRFRNLGAALLTGNVVEGFQALTAHSKSATDQLKEIEKALNLKEARTAGEQMQEFADRTAAAREEVAKAVDEIGTSKNTFDLQTASTRALGGATVEILGPVGDLAEKYGLVDIATRRLADGDTALSKALREQLDELDKTGAKAREYASDLKIAEQAVKDLTIAQLTAARNASLVSRTESVADNLAEAERIERAARKAAASPNLPVNEDDPKRIAAENAVVAAHTEVLRLRKELAAQEASLQATIAENRQASAESIASRTPSSKDELALARQERDEAQAAFDAGAKTALERSRLARALVEAKTKVVKLEQAVAAEEKQAADEADQARKDRIAAEKREAELRGQALRDALDLREQSLKLSLQDARANEDTIADDRKALLALIRFNHLKSENLHLEKSERLAAEAEEKSLRKDLSNLNKGALADALGVREQNLRNAIEAARLTAGTADDDKANDDFLRFLKRQVTAARKLKDGGKALADAKADLTAFQLSLKNSSGAGGSVTDLFQEAAREFEAFGSNIAPKGGVLSPQDARGAFAGDVLSHGVAPDRIDLGRLGEATLTEAQKQTAYLAQLVDLAAGGATKVAAPVTGNRGRIGSLDAIDINQAAAIFGLTP